MRLLVGDIGGTNTRLELHEGNSRGALAVVHAQVFDSGAHGDLAPIVNTFLDGHSVDAAAFGIAGPVNGRTCKTTNLPWHIDADALERDCRIPRVTLLNDFQAVALGIPSVPEAELCLLQDAEVDPDGPVAIIGAGTGLGQAVVVPTERGPRVLSSEGGHTDFGPRNADEIALLQYLLERHERVSVERVVSGLGLRAIYSFLTETGREVASTALSQALESEDPGKVIGEAALSRSDAACERAVRMFIELYGAEAGNLALKVLPKGGLYVAGGIAPKLLPLMQDGTFLKGFTHKGRMSALLENMRVTVVLCDQVGLLGARNAALHSL